MLARDKASHIILVGQRAAGKSTFAQLLADRGNARVVSAGGVMRDVLREQQLLDIVPRAAGALYVMRNLGFDAVARRMVDLGLVRIEESVVIDGLRSKEEIEFLVNLNFRVEVVCLSAPYNLRYARACHRKRDRDELSATGFHFEETLHLIMAGAPSFEELANVVVVNSGPIADLHSQADLLAEKFF